MSNNSIRYPIELKDTREQIKSILEANSSNEQGKAIIYGRPIYTPKMMLLALKMAMGEI